MWLPKQKHFYIVEILRNIELIKHRVICSNMFTVYKKTKHMPRKERQILGYKLNYEIVMIYDFIKMFWAESGIRGDPDRVRTTRPDPEHESPSHRPLFVPDWPGTYSQCCGPRSRFFPPLTTSQCCGAPGQDFSLHSHTKAQSLEKH
jgi:hypothetical protein